MESLAIWILSIFTPSALVAIGVWVGTMQGRIKQLENQSKDFKEAMKAIQDLREKFSNVDLLDIHRVKEKITVIEVILMQLADKAGVKYPPS